MRLRAARRQSASVSFIPASGSGLARLAALLAVVLTACSKAPTTSQQSIVPARQIPAEGGPTLVGPTAPAEADASLSASIVEEPATGPGQSAAPADAPLSLVALRQRYLLASSDPETRAEIIRQLGEIQSVDAIKALSQIFRREMREELRIEALGAVANMDEASVREERFAFLAGALDPKLPRLIRQLAINTLGEIEDTRVVPLLQSLHADADSQIRTFAAETLRDYQQ